MAIVDDLTREVRRIFKEEWAYRDGNVVPEPEDLKLSNDAVKLDAVVLYADMAESTDLVEKFPAHFAAEIYKTYLHCASKIIRQYEGTITSFDGDRVMGVYIGGMKNTHAVRSALAINHAVEKIINPQLLECYPNKPYTVKHAVGVDSSQLWAARTGIRGSNDIVWVGKSANYAAKMCSLRDGNLTSWISESVYKSMESSVKFTDNGSKNMWSERIWTKYNRKVYASTYYWAAS